MGDMWPMEPWDSWTESEGTSASEQCEHNVDSFALNVMEQDQPGEHISLFLEDWELVIAAAREACGHSKESLSLTAGMW